MPAYKVAKVARPGAFKRSGHFPWSNIFSKAEAEAEAEKLLVVRNSDLLLENVHLRYSVKQSRPLAIH